ncbi:MAG: GC-type dockerin domain-anchored protein [Phycisphaerales bacterium]
MGEDLYVGGEFTTVGGFTANGIARWDGTSWSSSGGLVSGGGAVRALAVFDDGTGPALYAGRGQGVGGFSGGLFKWNGTSWSAVSGLSSPSINALQVFDDGSGSGPALFIAGSFTSISGTVYNDIVKWDGSTLTALSGPSGTGSDGFILALEEFDPGITPFTSSTRLYAGGDFDNAGGVLSNNIASWAPSAWDDLTGASGTGVGGSTQPFVSALEVFDDGSGSGAALYAGGAFLTAGGMTALRVARWDGMEWSAVGDGFDSNVAALLAHDDGSGPALYAGGFFSNSGSVAARGIARLVACDPCRADFDGDGVLTLFDFLAFQTAFTDMDPEGDFNCDGLFNTFDFLAYQDAFDDGCP